MENLTWRTIDKAAWRRGVWDDEPDKEQWQDPATGLPCLLLRHHSLGHLCGYVGVVQGHPWHGLDHDNVPFDEDLYPHGGLTYAGLCQDGPDDRTICHVVPDEKPVWWLGFDCAHCGDLSPSGLMDSLGDAYRDVPFVKSECANLAQMIAAVA